MSNKGYLKAKVFRKSTIKSILLFSLVLTLLCIGFTNKSFAKVDDSFVIATTYYGFNPHSFPINYLSAVKDSEIDSDLKLIKEMRFNTIIILASWGEFQPVAGKSSEPAYRKINLIISKAKLNSLNVMIRLPYLWSLIAHDDIRTRTANALISKDSSRKELLEFLREFNELVVKKNGNVISVFGSWEDYYILRDLFFSGDVKTAASIREKFVQDTGLKIESVSYTGENYDVFMNWVDAKITELNKEIKLVFGSYGYEIRVDSDRYKKNGKSKWHSHNKFYKNESNGDVNTYWAPYFGQKNQGEKLSAEAALQSFNWMLDLIAAETEDIPFVGQLNFFDNTPGTESNAVIDPEQLDVFFQKLNKILIERTKGYGIWTIKDYKHNIIYNPIFAEGLTGWITSRKVVTDNSNVVIPEGGFLKQNISPASLQILGTNSALLVVDVNYGRGSVEVDEKKVFDVTGNGLQSFRVNLTTKEIANGINITIRAASKNGQTLSLKSVDLSGHEQIGKVFDFSGNPGEYLNLIKSFNENLAKSATNPCRQGTEYLESGFFSRHIFDDGWSMANITFCNSKREDNVGMEIEYYNPVKNRRTINIAHNKADLKTEILEYGVNKIRICPAAGQSLQTAVLSISSPLVPNKIDKTSQDGRSLGMKINSISRVKCL